MSHHHPPMQDLSAELQLMYLSRHIHVLLGALVNTVLGLYLHMQQSTWRRYLQIAGSLLVLASAVLLPLAFLVEPPLGFAGRGWRSGVGLIALFAGVMTHLAAAIGASRIDTTS